jgi:hypothetical protein
MNPKQRERLLALLFVLRVLTFPWVQTSEAGDLSWESGPAHRFARLEVAPHTNPGFSLVSAVQTGITFSNRLTDATIATNRLLELGSGVALGDVDGDGWVDIYFCSLEGGNALYRNLGNWKFEEATAGAGLICAGQYSTGCALVDIDGDGDLDLLVNGLGKGTREWLNDGKGHFTEATNSMLQRMSGATSLALSDVDGDGDLDLYVCNYRTDTFVDFPPGLILSRRQRPDGGTVVEPVQRFLTFTNHAGALEIVEKGEPDCFYVNRGAGRFTLARWDSGIFRDEAGKALSEAPTDWGLSVLFRDLNGDGFPDLYVCNDFVHWPDRIWLNQGGKRFKAADRHAFRNVSLSSMAVDVADINRDGIDDLFVADMLNPVRETRARQRPDTLKETIRWPVEDPAFRPEVPRNTFQLARGDGSFAEIAQLAGVAATDWTWGALFLDVDLDGWEDLLLSTGANHDVQDADVLPEIGRAVGWKTPAARLKAFSMLPERALPSRAFRNRRDLTFEEVGKQWGFDSVSVAHGMATADLDNDGDLDVVVNCLNRPAQIHRNLSTAPRLAVRLKGLPPNTRGIGARITVRGGPAVQRQEMIAGGRYLSSDDAMRVFAAGNAQDLQIEVSWRSGKRSVISGGKPNHVYEVDEAFAVGESIPVSTHGSSLFEDRSPMLKHDHVDLLYDDFLRQPLLPRKLSTLGPGVSWFDLNGDGFDDLVVGGGNTGRLAVFLNNTHGELADSSLSGEATPNPRDQTSVLAWRGADGSVRLLAGESSWEETQTPLPSFQVRSFNSELKGPSETLSNLSASASGPLTLADVDGDGDLDLFVGGRCVPGKYPQPASSRLFRNEGGRFVVMKDFDQLGMVSGAVFFDCDQDGDPDLALACDWGAIRVFRNSRGEFNEVTRETGLSHYTGMWNGVAAGDFDGDGKLDLVASNWGRNWRTDQVGATMGSVELFYGDFAENEVVQTLLASMDPALRAVTPWAERKRVVSAIPSIGAAFPTHASYGRAGIDQLLGEKSKSAAKLEATTFDSMIFLNRGDHWEAKALPVEAQFSPAFGVSVADFDGDGNEDLFLAQNFFGMESELSRQDAGTGLILLGDGSGGFRALTPGDSGIAMYGEQRGSAVADFDGDGRMDLAVGQNAGPTRLFLNRTAAVAARVKLRGAAANPDAVGASMRLRFGDRWSRRVEIHAGGGYWSQDSVVGLIAGPGAPSALEVIWPGGKRQEWAWPSGARSVAVSADGVTVK